MIKRLFRKFRPKDQTKKVLPEEIGKNVRAFASYRFIKGTGIEIGALHRPLKVYHSARVRYLDRLTVLEARKLYPELKGERLVEVDLLDDGETLSKVADESCDFVIANHFLEHCRNPIRTLENMLRILRATGVVYLAVPDKRRTFDLARPVTPYQHLVRDYLEGPEVSDAQHFEEQTARPLVASDRGVNGIPVIFAAQTNVHFHVWTEREILELLLNVRRDFGFSFEIELFARAGLEAVIVLRKGPLTEENKA